MTCNCLPRKAWVGLKVKQLSTVSFKAYMIQNLKTELFYIKDNYFISANPNV